MNLSNLKYNDMLKKYQYYKEHIINDYVNQGVFPNTSIINNTIERINLALPILQDYKVAEGSFFDTNHYNDTFNQVKQDLIYLYELLYDLNVAKYQELQSYMDLHLTDLNTKLKEYKQRALIEINSTSLGKTILFNTNCVPAMEHNTLYIDLDNIVVHKNSKLACFLNANNVSMDDIVFILTNVDTGEQLFAPVYNNNQYSINIPGEITFNDHYFNYSDETIKYDQINLNIGSNNQENNDYHIFSGKNMIIVNNRELDNYDIIDAPLDHSYVVNSKSYIEFYVVNSIGSEIAFSFNKKPISANFNLENHSSVIDKHIKHYYFECEAGTVFNISLYNGTIYACSNKILLQDNKDLIVNNKFGFSDFLVKEIISNNNTAEYKVRVRINNVFDQIEIDNVYIKELLQL